MSFILRLLLVVLVLGVLRYIVPRVLRTLLGSFVRQQMHKAQQAGGFPPGFNPMGGQPRPAPGPPPTAPGQVRIDYVPPPARPTAPQGFKSGDYTDYEEL